MPPRLIAVALALALSAPAAARAQGSPIVDLLLRSRGALNDLRYSEADSLATTVLSAFADRLSRDQRLEALGIRAASLFPEAAGGGTQQPDSALAYLRQVVRLDPAASRLRGDLSWEGLDSLYRMARGSVLAIWTTPPAEFALVGPNGIATLEVRGTRPARYVLAMVDTLGSSRLGDTVAAAGAIEPVGLRLRAAFNGTTPAPLSGEYRMRIVAYDAESADTAVLEYRATMTVPVLAVTPVPGPFDTTLLRRERVKPARGKGILSGLLVGGATIAGSVVLGSASGGASGSGADARAYGVGIALAAGAIVAGMMDRGAPLPENAAFNAKARSDHADLVRRTGEENQRRVNEHRTTIALHLEQR